jgi:hypothetical protein
MADHGPTTLELVEVKAEEIIEERKAFYGRFLTGLTWVIGATVTVIILMWIFLV